MKLLPLSVAVLCLLVAELCCGQRAPSEELAYWAASDETPDEWLASDSFRELMRRMTRKPRPHQFFGLMGKRSPTNPQITRKRQKLNSFVGLMGKRSQEEPDSYEWNTVLNYGQR